MLARRLLTIAAMLVIALLAGARQDAPKAAYLVRSGEKVELFVVAKSETKRVAEVEANWLLWNALGSRLAIHSAPSGKLWVWRDGQESMVEVAQAAHEPAWASDGAKLLFRKPDGELLVYIASVVGSEPISIAKGVRCAAWSPDGSRLAYATKESIWICDATGENPRENVPDQTAVAITWSPDGRSLAFIEPGLGAGTKATLMTAAVTGSTKVKKANVDGKAIAWSPDGKRIAVETAAGVEIVDLDTGKPIAVAANFRGPLLWSGSGLLCGVHEGKASEFDVAERKARPMATMAEKSLVTASVVVPLHLGNQNILSDPLAHAPKPEGSHLALRGVVVAQEPLEEQFTVAVESTRDAAGTERFYNRPIEQTVQINFDTMRITPERTRALRSIDLKLDDEVVVIVTASMLDSRAVLGAKSVTIAGDVIPDQETRPSKPAPRIKGTDIEYDGVSREKVVVPMTFPVLGSVWYEDWFLAPRAGGRRRHHGQDLMAKKMTPLIACFDGKVVANLARPGGHHTIKIRGTNGWTACYYHVNNDTPGTDDGNGGATYAFAPGLRTGQFVYEGQFIGFVGDSGNAETTAPHLHFELWDDQFGAVVNAFPSLKAATKLTEPRYVAPAPDLKPNVGEQRVDGIVRKVDDGHETLRMDLVARYDGGRMRVVTFPTSVWGKIGTDSRLEVRGKGNVRLTPKEVRAGLQGTLVGVQPAKDRAILTRIGAFER